eukprot:gene4022-7278_t
MLETLENAEGTSGATSVVSLLISPTGSTIQMASQLSDKLSTVDLKTAMTSTIGLLKGYKKPPKNGLAIFCGLVELEGKEKKIALAFEPMLPIKSGFYLCDNRFHVESLQTQLKSSEKSYGFIICNGDGTLFGKVNGGAKEIILHLKDPNLPRKHNKGGQSATRFARITQEARHVYLKKVSESASKVFIKNDVPNVACIFLAGCGPLKYKLLPYLDKRVQKIISEKILDTSYGGELGFQLAIDMASQSIENHKYNFEIDLINDFMKEIALNTSKVIFGVKETMNLIDMGITSKIVLSENLKTVRIVTEDGVKFYQNEEKLKNASISEGVLEKQFLVDYLIERDDLKVEIISDSTSEGKQFLQGFGGLGAFLKFQYQEPIEFIEIVEKEEEINEDDDEFDDLSEFIEYKKFLEKKKKKRSGSSPCLETLKFDLDESIPEKRSLSEPTLKIKETVTIKRDEKKIARKMIDVKGFISSKPISLDAIMDTLHEQWDESIFNVL